MIKSEDCIVWTNRDTRTCRVTGREISRQHLRIQEPGSWSDPIGARYTQWRQMKPDQRAALMVETAIDLAMQGYDLGSILREFAKVDAFRALGSASYPMCRALTKAMIGRSYEPNTMTFEELMVTYAQEVPVP
jgi:hypothetical protein